MPVAGIRTSPQSRSPSLPGKLLEILDFQPVDSHGRF